MLSQVGRLVLCHMVCARYHKLNCLKNFSQVRILVSQLNLNDSHKFLDLYSHYVIWTGTIGML